jgi:hypothetical protein
MKTLAPIHRRGVCRVGSLLLFALLFSTAAAALQAQGSAVRVETFSLKLNGEVVVENPRGATRVESWDFQTVRVVAENLVAILGTPRVTLYPTLATDVDFRVQIEVRNFESAPGKSASLDAVWTVRRIKDGKTETGRTSVIRYTVIQDAGKAVHPTYVEGQFQGGAAQGIGWALNEEYVYGKDGRLQNAGFLDYRIPVCSDLPFIDTQILEIPNPNHPYGVRGVGETSIVPPLAAVANAVSNAVGVRMTHVPMSPPRILKAIEDAKGH